MFVAHRAVKKWMQLKLSESSWQLSKSPGGKKKPKILEQLFWLDVNSETCYWLQCLCGFFGSGEISSDTFLFCSVRIAKSEGKLGQVFMCY